MKLQNDNFWDKSRGIKAIEKMQKNHVSYYNDRCERRNTLLNFSPVSWGEKHNCSEKPKMKIHFSNG